MKKIMNEQFVSFLFCCAIGLIFLPLTQASHAAQTNSPTIEIPDGWTNEKTTGFRLEATEKFSAQGKTEVLCNGRVSATREEYTNPNNDYTVARRVTLTGIDAVRIRLTLMHPINFPNMTRVARWEYSGIWRDVGLTKGASQSIDNPNYQVGWNLGYRCL